MATALLILSALAAAASPWHARRKTKEARDLHWAEEFAAAMRRPAPKSTFHVNLRGSK